MHPVFELIRSANLAFFAKNHCVFFRQMAELIVLILKVEVGELDLIDDFFAQDRVHRKVLELGLTGDFVSRIVVPRIESHLIRVDNHELPTQPFNNGLV